MEPLIYTVAFGSDHYKQFAQALVRSAREAGYDGHIVVITDFDKKWHEKLEAENCTAVDGFNITLDKPARPKKVVIGKILRYYLPAIWDISRYDVITYIDCDSLFQRKSETPVDALFATENRFAQEAWQVFGSQYNNPTTSTSALPSGLFEKIQGRRIVNSGGWTVKSNDFIRFAEGVRHFFRQSPNQSDQACVNAFLYSHEDVFDWEFMTLDVISNHAMDVDSVVKHYGGRAELLAYDVADRYPDIRPWWVDKRKKPLYPVYPKDRVLGQKPKEIVR